MQQSAGRIEPKAQSGIRPAPDTDVRVGLAQRYPTPPPRCTLGTNLRTLALPQYRTAIDVRSLIPERDAARTSQGYPAYSSDATLVGKIGRRTA